MIVQNRTRLMASDAHHPLNRKTRMQLLSPITYAQISDARLKGSVSFGSGTSPAAAMTNTPVKAPDNSATGCFSFSGMRRLVLSLLRRVHAWINQALWRWNGGDKAHTASVISNLLKPASDADKATADAHRAVHNEHYLANQTRGIPSEWMPRLSIKAEADATDIQGAEAAYNGTMHTTSVFNPNLTTQANGRFLHTVVNVNHEAEHAARNLLVLNALSQTERTAIATDATLQLLRRGGHIPFEPLYYWLKDQPIPTDRPATGGKGMSKAVLNAPINPDRLRTLNAVLKPLLLNSHDWAYTSQLASKPLVAGETLDAVTLKAHQALLSLEKALFKILEPSAPSTQEPSETIRPQPGSPTHAAMIALLDGWQLIHQTSAQPPWYTDADRRPVSDTDKIKARQIMSEKVWLSSATTHRQVTLGRDGQPTAESLAHDAQYQFHPEEVAAKISANERLGELLGHILTEADKALGANEAGRVKQTAQRDRRISQSESTLWQAGAQLWQQFQGFYGQLEAGVNPTEVAVSGSDKRTLLEKAYDARKQLVELLVAQREQLGEHYNALHPLIFTFNRALRQRLASVVASNQGNAVVGEKAA